MSSISDGKSSGRNVSCARGFRSGTAAAAADRRPRHDPTWRARTSVREDNARQSTDEISLTISVSRRKASRRRDEKKKKKPNKTDKIRDVR